MYGVVEITILIYLFSGQMRMLYFNGALCFWTALPPYLMIGLFTVKDSFTIICLCACCL